MDRTTEIKTNRLEDADDRDIDYSDIPELTDEYLSHCLVRFRNRPIGQGGEWHKPVLGHQMSDERLAELKARARAEWEAREDGQNAERELGRIVSISADETEAPAPQMAQG